MNTHEGGLVNQQDEKELAEIRGWKAEMDKREAALLARAGSGGGGGPSGTAGVIAAEQRIEEERALLYDKMTPSELMKLWETDRAAWQEVLDAKQAQGMRKLIRWR
jgi:hypothetical protein